MHSSAFVSQQEAIDELVQSVENGAEHLMIPRTLKMRVGRCRRSWVGNCVAIGLADGFIEPLEATAIHFIDLSCRRLLQCFPSTDFEEALAGKFNRHMETLYDDVLTETVRLRDLVRSYTGAGTATAPPTATA